MIGSFDGWHALRMGVGIGFSTLSDVVLVLDVHCVGLGEIAKDEYLRVIVIFNLGLKFLPSG